MVFLTEAGTPKPGENLKAYPLSTHSLSTIIKALEGRAPVVKNR